MNTEEIWLPIILAIITPGPYGGRIWCLHLLAAIILDISFHLSILPLKYAGQSFRLLPVLKKIPDTIQVLIWPMSRLWWQEKYSIERRHHLQCHDTNRDISGQMENIDGPKSAQQRQIGILRVGLTFMNWNGWKMKGRDEAVNRADYMIVFLVWEIILLPPPSVSDNIKISREIGRENPAKFKVWASSFGNLSYESGGLGGWWAGEGRTN